MNVNGLARDDYRVREKYRKTPCIMCVKRTK